MHGKASFDTPSLREIRSKRKNVIRELSSPIAESKRNRVIGTLLQRMYFVSETECDSDCTVGNNY